MERIHITNKKTGVTYKVMFNPEEYSLNKDNNFAAQAIPGLGSPILQFVHGNMRTLDMELFFDTFELGTDVRSETQNVVDLLKINSDLHAPPLLQVTWGSLDFQCVLAKVAQKYIKFFPDGRPARARLNVTFNECLDPAAQVKDANLQTADFSKAHTVQEGESLSSIAGNYYEDPAKWRPIALANGILDPRSISPGQQLQVPSLPFTDPSTGVVMQ
jgi:Contractile injection system tube protein/LysM domain